MFASEYGTAAGNLVADRYQLVTAIGHGGAGTVWRSLDTLLQREVAVKEIGLGPGADEPARDEAAQRTFREARAAARIRHPGVVAVYDVVTAEDRLYIVMELVEGRPLAEVISAEGPMPAERVADIGRQLLAAVTAGHAAGVLHRDLKPGNVLITPEGRAVLTDFGIASMAGDPSITRTGYVVGTPGYVAPERARGESATPAADLWSLGATLYAAISGSGPFDHHGSAIATLYAVATQDAPPLPGGDAVQEMIGALLSRDPRLRPDAAAAARAFEAPPPEPLADPPPAENGPVTVTSGRPPLASGSAPVPAPGPGSAGPAAAAVAVEDILRGPSEPPPGKPRSVPLRARTPRSPRPPRPSQRSRGYGVLLVAAAAVCLASALTVIVKSPGQNSPAGSNAAQVVVAPALSQEFRVAAAANAAGGIDLFATARNGRLMSGQLANGAWSGWTALPSQSLRFSGVPAVVAGSDGRLHVFARTTAGKLAEFWQPASGSRAWAGPAQIGAQLIGGDPAVVALRNAHLEVFVPIYGGTLDEVSELSTAGAGTWAAWTSLAGHLSAPPVAAIGSDGSPEVFAPGPDNGLGYDVYQGTAWSGWRALPGGREFAAATPAVGVNFDSRLELFARTRSGALVHVWQQPRSSTSWGGPLPLGTPIGSDPAVVTVQGRMDVFATAPGGAILHVYQLQAVAGTNWSALQPAGGTSDGVPVPVLAGSQEDVFARTAGGAVAWAHRLPGGGWSAWQSLGGAF